MTLKSIDTLLSCNRIDDSFEARKLRMLRRTSRVPIASVAALRKYKREDIVVTILGVFYFPEYKRWYLRFFCPSRNVSRSVEQYNQRWVTQATTLGVKLQVKLQRGALKYVRTVLTVPYTLSGLRLANALCDVSGLCNNIILNAISIDEFVIQVDYIPSRASLKKGILKALRVGFVYNRLFIKHPVYDLEYFKRCYRLFVGRKVAHRLCML